MKKVITLLMMKIIFATTFAASPKMVLLVESENGKHIGIKDDLGLKLLHENSTDWFLYPDISADGTKVTYVQGTSQDDLKIIVENIESGVIKELSVPAGFVLQPKFAKRATEVFFTMSHEGKNKIGKIGINAASYEFLTSDDSVSEFFPVPFENGEKLILQRNLSNGERKIVLKNLISDKELIIDDGMSPTLSKDEMLIAYTKKVEENWDVYIYNILTKKTLRVTEHEANDFSPAFDLKNNLFFTTDRLEKGVFSVFKKSKATWEQEGAEVSVYHTNPGVSFYAPRISGNTDYKLSLRSPMYGEARSSFGAIEHKGFVYVAGGHQGAEHTYPPESFTGRVEAYDLKTGEWRPLAPRNFKAHGFQLAAHDDYIYAFGGFAYEGSTSPAWKSLDVVERYDIGQNKWEVVAQMPRRRSSNIVAKVGTNIFVMGGWDSTPKFNDDIDGTFHDEIDVFDLKTNTFTTLKQKLPFKRRAFTAVVNEKNIYLIGGISEGGSHFALLDDVTEFNTKTNSFTKVASLPFATFAPAAGLHNGKLFVFGGMFKLGKWEYEYTSHIYEYRFDLKSWGHTGRYLSEQKGFSQVVQLPDSLGVLGGHSYKNNSDSPVKTFEIFK